MEGKDPKTHLRWVKLNIRLCLIGVGVLGIMRGVVYFPEFDLRGERLPSGIAAISEFIPIQFWCICWIVAGALALYSGIRRPGPRSVSGVAAMCAVWGIGFFAGQFINPESTSYLSGYIYFLISGLLSSGAYVYALCMRLLRRLGIGQDE